MLQMLCFILFLSVSTSTCQDMLYFCTIDRSCCVTGTRAAWAVHEHNDVHACACLCQCACVCVCEIVCAEQDRIIALCRPAAPPTVTVRQKREGGREGLRKSGRERVSERDLERGGV